MKSSSSRVMLIPATPEEIRSGGAGIEIRWGLAESPFGKMFLARSPRGITHLSFFDDGETESLDVLKKDWPNASLMRDDGLAASVSREIFRGKSGAEFRLHVKGTAFQQKVWEALLEISDGSLSTYGKLACGIGMEGASRAVGNAVGANRISYLIPCHRVIRAAGGLGGYRWGAERKRIMLEREQCAPQALDCWDSFSQLSRQTPMTSARGDNPSLRSGAAHHKSCG